MAMAKMMVVERERARYVWLFMSLFMRDEELIRQLYC